MAKMKDFPKEIVDLITEKALDKIRQDVIDSQLPQPTANWATALRVNPFVAEIVDAFIEASNAIDTAVNIGVINKYDLEVGIKYAPNLRSPLVPLNADHVGTLLTIAFKDDRQAHNLRAIFHGGEVVKDDGKTIILNGTPGYNERYIQEVSNRVSTYLKNAITENDPDVKALIAKYERKTRENEE